MKTIRNILLSLAVVLCAQVVFAQDRPATPPDQNGDAVATNTPAAEPPPAEPPAVQPAIPFQPQAPQNGPRPGRPFNRVPAAGSPLTGPQGTPGAREPRKTVEVPPAVARESNETGGADEMVPAGMIDFRATPLDQVLEVYAKFVGKTLLRPANLGSPQVTLQTQTPLTKSEVIQALDTVLGMNGVSMVDFGDKFVKAVPQAQVNTEGAPIDGRSATNMEDFGPYLTHVVQLKYVKPSEMATALTPFAKVNSIIPIDSSQILILRDYTENVKRMLEMISRVDIDVPTEFTNVVIPIKYAKAEDIADALNSLGGGSGGTSIGQRPASTGGARGGLNSNQRLGGQGFNGGQNNGFQNNGQNGFGGAQPQANSFTSRLQNIIRKASATGDMQIIGENKIITDERSNSLLIFCSKQDLVTITNIIAKLDVVLSQVLVETAILDVQLGKGWNYGLSAGQDVKTNGSFITGGAANSQSGGLGTLADLFSGAVGSNSTVFPSANGLSYFGRYTGGIDLALQAAATDSRVSVIQRPQILTTHATPGSIFIGSTVPYITTSYYGGAYGSPGSSYQQLQVGIGLNVTPYINQDGLVVMQIDETIDEISGSTTIANVGAVPNTTHRSLSAEVAVRDGDTIMLGGFVRNSDDKEVAGVPILMDIPILGALFKSKSDTKARDELLVLMRPTVLKTPAIAAEQTAMQKSSMPGVLGAEREIGADIREQLRQEQKLQKLDRQRAQKEKFDTGAPVTPEERKYLFTPGNNSTNAPGQ